MNTAAVIPSYGFEELPGDGFVELKVIPPPLGVADAAKGFGMKVIFAFAGLVVGFFVSAFFKSSWAMVFPLIGAVGAWLWLGRMMRTARGEILKTAHIKVSPEGVALDGKLFAREHISDFWVQQGQGEFVVGSSDGPGVARYSDDVMKRMFSLQMRYGAEPVVLVNGVTEGTAKALMEKVSSAYKKYMV